MTTDYSNAPFAELEDSQEDLLKEATSGPAWDALKRELWRVVDGYEDCMISQQLKTPEQVHEFNRIQAAHAWLSLFLQNPQSVFIPKAEQTQQQPWRLGAGRKFERHNRR